MTAAVWKPWGLGPRPAVLSAVESAAPSPQPARVATADFAERPPGSVLCWSRAWRIVVIERRSREPVLLRASVSPGSSPTDARIALADARASDVLGLGYCAPRSADRADIRVALWRVRDGAADRIPLWSLGRYVPPGPGTADIYRAPRPRPSHNAPRLAAWPPGRYVFAVSESGGPPLFFGIELSGR